MKARVLRVLAAIVIGFAGLAGLGESEEVSDITLAQPLQAEIRGPTQGEIPQGKFGTLVWKAEVSGGTEPHIFTWKMERLQQDKEKETAPVRNPENGVAVDDQFFFTFSRADNYRLELKVRDAYGTEVEPSVDITVEEADAELQVSILNPPGTVRVGEKATWVADIEGGSRRLNFEWFLDGELVSENSVLRRVFTKAGPRELELRVTEGDGDPTVVEQEVAVEPPRPLRVKTDWPTDLVVGQEFTAEATVLRGQPPYDFQWWVDGVPLEEIELPYTISGTVLRLKVRVTDLLNGNQVEEVTEIPIFGVNGRPKLHLKDEGATIHGTLVKKASIRLAR